MSAENVALVRRGYEAMARGDLDVIAAILAPDVKWHGGVPGGEGGCRNRSEALAVMRGARRRGPMGELVDAIGVDDHVVVVLRRRNGENGGGEPVANLT